MIDTIIIGHHIQRHILGVLYHQKIARFRDLRPQNVDTNLYSYHLRSLIKQGMLRKVEGGYTLGDRGLAYIDRVSSKSMLIRTQPKIVTMIVAQNSNGDVLLQRRTKQPHLDTWTLPYGKLHIEDYSILGAARREADEKLGLIEPSLIHAGDCYIRVYTGKGEDRQILSSTLVHVFYLETDDIVVSEKLQWARPHKLAEFDLAPAVEQIVARTFFRDPYFFEEYEADMPGW